MPSLHGLKAPMNNQEACAMPRNRWANPRQNGTVPMPPKTLSNKELLAQCQRGPEAVLPLKSMGITGRCIGQRRAAIGTVPRLRQFLRDPALSQSHDFPRGVPFQAVVTPDLTPTA